MSFDHYLRRVMSGAERGPRAASLRAALALVEPFYAAAAALRNRMYERRLLTIRTLSRPVISIGNLTAGGTGKTPVVRWLASKLREEGRRVAILSRGYRAAGGAGALGDEQVMLDRLLNQAGAAEGAENGAAPVAVRAHPDRAAAADAALRDNPGIDVFLVDDGFQHRRVARDLDIVLINAAEPFGHGRVLPRGLLREPLSGLRRAGAVVLTHSDRVDETRRAQIQAEILRRRPDVPIFQAVHAPIAFRTSEGNSLPLDALRSRRAFAFCGLASPEVFERDVRNLCNSYAGHQWFADHHTYTASDRAQVQAAARASGADVVVTTEKDWAKLADFPPLAREDLPIWRLDVAIQFSEDDEQRLLALVRMAISSCSAAPAPAG